jgi:hypothetical protein
MRGEQFSFYGETVVDQLAIRVGMATGRRPFHLRLTEGVNRALRQGRQGRVCLRGLVYEIVCHATTAGVHREEVRIALVEFINEHPLCDQLDRIRLTDGRRTSECLAAQVDGWVDFAWEGFRRHALEMVS